MPFPLPVFKLLLLSLPVLFIRTLAVFIQLLIKLLRGVRATECTAVSVKLTTKRGFKMREQMRKAFAGWDACRANNTTQSDKKLEHGEGPEFHGIFNNHACAQPLLRPSGFEIIPTSWQSGKLGFLRAVIASLDGAGFSFVG